MDASDKVLSGQNGVNPADPLYTPGGTGDSSSFESGTKFQIKPVGTSGTELFAGYFSEEYLQQLRGKKGAKAFDEIRRSEAQVAMLLAAVMNPIKSATWEFEAARNVQNGDMHKAFMEYNAKEMIDWETYLHEALTFLIHGFSIFEVINNVVIGHPMFGTFNGLKALAFRSQKTIEKWIVDRTTGDLQSVVQWVQGDLAAGRNAMIDMPAQFLQVLSSQKEGDNYEGISALRPMYGAYYRKNLYLRLMGIGIEKNAVGTPLGTIPKGKLNAGDEAKFKETLENFTGHESAYLTIPEGWKIEILKNDFDPSKLKDAILMENTEMINAMVANFLALGMNGGSGAFALGNSLAEFFLNGLEVYANIIAGNWNRKITPNLIKLNFGPQSSYPKLRVTGISDKAGKEIADILGVLTKSNVIKADMKLEEFMRRQYKMPPADLATTRELINVTERIQTTPGADPNAEPGTQLGEKRILPPQNLKLAETWKKQWKSDKGDLKALMTEQLTLIRDDLKAQIVRAYKNATPAARAGIALNIQPRSGAYKKVLQEALAKIANTALIDAKKRTPKAKDVKLSESIQLAAPKGGYFDALPDNIKRIVKNQAGLIADTQASDLDKIVSFQYNSSQTSTEDIDLILNDIDGATEPTLDGSTSKGLSIDAAAGDAVSSTANQAALEWFFEPEVLDTIESFTFTNEDPVSEICQELDGTTWAVDDPDLDRYSPPLHHNCKSRLEPNEKGVDGNPDVTRGGTALTQKALDSITLCEGHYHLSFQLVEPKGKASTK